MTHIAGTGHQTRDCSPAGLRESCCNPCTVRLLLRFSSTLSVASCNHEGDYHYWVGIDFPRAMAHIARPEPKSCFHLSAPLNPRTSEKVLQKPRMNLKLPALRFLQGGLLRQLGALPSKCKRDMSLGEGQGQSD